ncbi:hypothetical protein [Agromyces bracchium]|uniref:Helix-turn-helix domain-containing protein n=1 Tax=Agromyces bracchium TaxID=88376 RepID=A0A6I3M818_9MICO|nr:hypothetical protein [Agromyces bracchium]MTH69375.1 hypothetical protein [Agromyces bracchium]
MGLFAAKSAVLVAARLGLGNAATRLLLHMALECWDEDTPDGRPARRYFGGREMSAVALGFTAPENGGPAAHQAVKRAVRELVKKGAIVRVRAGGRGLPAEYELLVSSSKPSAARAAVDNPVVLQFPARGQGVIERTPQGVAHRTP